MAKASQTFLSGFWSTQATHQLHTLLCWSAPDLLAVSSSNLVPSDCPLPILLSEYALWLCQGPHGRNRSSFFSGPCPEVLNKGAFQPEGCSLLCPALLALREASTVPGSLWTLLSWALAVVYLGLICSLKTFPTPHWFRGKVWISLFTGLVKCELCLRYEIIYVSIKYKNLTKRVLILQWRS